MNEFGMNDDDDVLKDRREIELEPRGQWRA